MFRKIVRYFGPEWGAAAMGIAALSITLQLASEVSRAFSSLLYIGLGFYLLATFLFVLFLVPWTLRFFWFPKEISKDLSDPVRSNFFPTVPITFILAGTGTNKLGPLLFGPSVSYTLAVLFFFIGAIGIFIFGLILTRSVFLNENLRLENANFAWFIAPVSHLIIAVLGACSMDVHWAETALSSWLFVISMIALGVGIFSFLFVGAAVWHRYIYSAIPEGRLSATIMVAIAPTSVIVIFLMKFAEALEASHDTLFGLEFATVFPVVQISASILWGFSAWWLILATTIIFHYIKTSQHPVAFSWWAYTFPFEAFIVATGLLAKVVATQLLHPLLILLNAIAVLFWIIVVFATLKWLQSGAYFEEKNHVSRLKPVMVNVGLAIILFPFVIGIVMFSTATARNYEMSAKIQKGQCREQEVIIEDDIELKWSFIPDYRYKPLILGENEYMVFMFDYINHSDFTKHITPSYSFISQKGKRSPANEEISAYIEDAIEDKVGYTSQTPMPFAIPAHQERHYIAAFEKTHGLNGFTVNIELFNKLGWSLSYEKSRNEWINTKNTILSKKKDYQEKKTIIASMDMKI
ncbi:MAG: hypothetical protein JW795_16060 [Chitinivibrionales bacterium]|nr:hypothetical protein [Chitinivibrionales bacterium]